MELVDVYQVKYFGIFFAMCRLWGFVKVIIIHLTGFSLCAENPCESTQRDLVSCPRSPPWWAWVSICLLTGRTCIDFPGGSLGSPAPTLAKGSSLKKSDPQTVFAVTLKLVFTETFPSIFPRFSMKRVTCFRFEQSFNIDEPFAQSVVKFAFKKDQHNALKIS